MINNKLDKAIFNFIETQKLDKNNNPTNADIIFEACKLKSKLLEIVGTIDKPKPKLSFRRSMLVILEEKIQDTGETNRDKYVKSSIQNEAYIRFSISHRNSKNKWTLNEIHPYKPCDYFENLPRKRGEYIKSLNIILSRIKELTKNTKVNGSLQFILEDLSA